MQRHECRKMEEELKALQKEKVLEQTGAKKGLSVCILVDSRLQLIEVLAQLFN